MPNQLPWDRETLKQNEYLEACDYCGDVIVPGAMILRRDTETACGRYCATRVDVITATTPNAEGR